MPLHAKRQSYHYKTHSNHRNHHGIASFWTVLVLLVLLLSGLVAQLTVKPLSHIQLQPPFLANPLVSLPAVRIATKSLGIAAGSSLTALDQTTLSQRLVGMKALGASWVRFDFNWSLIQPNNSREYDWSSVDRVVAVARQQHENILGIIDYTPAWARPSQCQQSMQCPPADAQQFADFASSAAKRYASEGVYYWEIWNEPNNPNFWQPKADPAAYTSLLRHAYAAIKQAVPQAFVLTGGLSPQPTNNVSYAPVDFFNEMYARGAHGSFDAVSDHPYTFPLSPSSKENHAWNQMARTTSSSLRTSMLLHGDGDKKIWITEFGAPTGGPGPVATVTNLHLSESPYVVDEVLQAAMLQDAINLYRTYTWAGPFLYYSYQDASTDQSTNENFFGLLRYDGSHKPAYAVFQAAAGQPL